MKYLKTKQLRVLDAGDTPRSVESSSEQGWKQGIQGAVVAWGEVHRRAISCSDVFHKGPLPNGDADLEHCTLSFSTGNLKLTVIVGLLLVKIMNLRRVQSDAQYLLREVKFHWRKPFSQPSRDVCAGVHILQMGKPRLGEVNQLPRWGSLQFPTVGHNKSPCALWPVCPWDSPGKHTGVGCQALLLQGIFPIQGSNLGLLHCRQTLYCLSHHGSPPAALVQF